MLGRLIANQCSRLSSSLSGTLRVKHSHTVFDHNARYSLDGVTAPGLEICNRCECRQTNKQFLDGASFDLIGAQDFEPGNARSDEASDRDTDACFELVARLE